MTKFKKLVVEWEDGTKRTYEVEGLSGVMNRLARLEATNEKVFTKNKIKSYKVEDVTE